MQRIKTAIVGFGISGQCFQAPIIEYCEQLELVAVVSSDKTKVLEQLPEVIVYAQLEAMLEDQEIELVIIATPNHLHVPQAKLTLQAGKHVVIEKPFSITSSEGQELIDLARKAQLTLSVYQSRRFDGDFKTIEKLIDSGKLDDIHTFYSSYNRYKPEVKSRWREDNIAGSGILYDLGAHLIDQTLCLFGMPERVTATLRNQRPGALTVDHFHLILHYPQTDAILHSNCLSTDEGPRFQIFGRNSSFIKYGMDPQEDFLREKKGPESQGWGQDCLEHFATYTDHNNTSYKVPTEQGEYQSFYQQLARSIRFGSELPVKAEEALDVIRIIEAAYLSAEKQCSVIIKDLP